MRLAHTTGFPMGEGPQPDCRLFVPLAIPDSWDEGEETANEVYRTAQEESNTEGDES